jgi:hypothetical protein
VNSGTGRDEVAIHNQEHMQANYALCAVSFLPCANALEQYTAEFPIKAKDIR